MCAAGIAGDVGELITAAQEANWDLVRHAEHNHQVGIVLREWAEQADLFPRFVERVGQVVTGCVTKIASIGFFVGIADCVEGLVPLTEPVADLAKIVREGQDMSVRIIAVGLERARVLLSAEGVA